MLDEYHLRVGGIVHVGSFNSGIYSANKGTLTDYEFSDRPSRICEPEARCLNTFKLCLFCRKATFPKSEEKIFALQKACYYQRENFKESFLSIYDLASAEIFTWHNCGCVTGAKKSESFFWNALRRACLDAHREYFLRVFLKASRLSRQQELQELHAKIARDAKLCSVRSKTLKINPLQIAAFPTIQQHEHTSKN